VYVAYEFRQQHRHETVSLYLSVGNNPFWISISIQIEWKSGYESGSIQTLTVEHMLLNRNVRNSVRCRLHFRTEHVDFLNIISRPNRCRTEERDEHGWSVVRGPANLKMELFLFPNFLWFLEKLSESIMQTTPC
jgi:hypothetical protein